MQCHGRSRAMKWVCLKIVYPIYPMVLLIIIPMKNGYFIGNINPTFSNKPKYHAQGTSGPHGAVLAGLRRCRSSSAAANIQGIAVAAVEGGAISGRATWCRFWAKEHRFLSVVFPWFFPWFFPDVPMKKKTAKLTDLKYTNLYQTYTKPSFSGDCPKKTLSKGDNTLILALIQWG